MADPRALPDQSGLGYRLMVIYEVTGTDRYEAEAKLGKLDRAAKRIGSPAGFVDNAGEVTLDEERRS